MRNCDTISIKSKIGVEFKRYPLTSRDVESFDKFYKKIESYHDLVGIPFVIYYADIDNLPLPINNDDNLEKAVRSAKHIASYSLEQPDQNGNNRQHNISYSNNSNHLNNNSNNNNNNNIYHHNQFTHNGANQYITPRLVRRPLMKLFIERRGDHLDLQNPNFDGKCKKNQPFSGISNLILSSNDQNVRPSIGMPEDFRQVSSIIDVDIVPKYCRRVRIVKHGTDRPLGFYIRDGTYQRMNANGQRVLVTGIFISRLVPGGLAESTGLLAVNDEVIEVNGIDVTDGKTLEQVTDMMIVNSSDLIITIRPGEMHIA